METKIFYNINQIHKLAKKYPDIVMDETEDVMSVIVARLEKEVAERTPAGVGGAAGLRGSIEGKVLTFGRTVYGSVDTPLEYGEVRELGRRPGKGFPPPGPIELWVRSILGVDEKKVKSVAFLVARKIAVKGFEGAHMFERAWEENEGWIMDQLDNIYGKVVKRLEQ